MRPRVLLLLSALAIALGLALWRPWASAPIRAHAHTIILITPDTLTRSYVGAFGPKGVRSITPRIDALAARGTVRTEAWTPVPLTLPAHATMLSGRDPAQTGVRTNAYGRLPTREARGWPMLQESLHDANWHTAAFVSAGVLAARYGLDQGFDLYDDEGLDDASGYSVKGRSGARTVRAALAHMRSVPKDKPLFVWVHLFDPHQPWTEGSGYAGGVVAVDTAIGGLLDGLRAAGRETATVLLAADHGEALGDLGEASHGLLLGDAVLRVPFVMARLGDSSDNGQRDDRPIRLSDIARLLASEAGLDPAPWAPQHPAVIAESLYPHALYRWAQLVAVSDATGTLVDAGGDRLHWLPRAAPGQPQAGPLRAPTDARTRRLATLIATYRQTEAPTEGQAGQASSYYGGSGEVSPFLAPEANAALPDPYTVIGRKDHLDAIKRTLAMKQTTPRMLEAALGRLEDLGRLDPDNPEVNFLRGRALRRLAPFSGASGPSAPIALLSRARDAFVQSFRQGRRETGTVLEAVDAAAGAAAGPSGDRKSAAKAGLALLEALGADLAWEDCRLELLRARMLRDRGEEGDEARAAAACRHARDLCARPSQRGPLKATCGD